MLLAVGFGMAGFMKLTTPFEELTKMLPWAAGTGEGLARRLGVSYRTMCRWRYGDCRVPPAKVVQLKAMVC